jgi:hypothetical protein
VIMVERRMGGKPMAQAALNGLGGGACDADAAAADLSRVACGGGGARLRADVEHLSAAGAKAPPRRLLRGGVARGNDASFATISAVLALLHASGWLGA